MEEFFISISILGFISFYDDIKIVHPLYRLCAHLFVALISLAVFSYIDHDLFLIIPEKLFGNTLEAIIGSIYIDKGTDKTKQFIINNTYYFH